MIPFGSSRSNHRQYLFTDNPSRPMQWKNYECDMLCGHLIQATTWEAFKQIIFNLNLNSWKRENVWRAGTKRERSLNFSAPNRIESKLAFSDGRHFLLLKRSLLLARQRRFEHTLSIPVQLCFSFKYMFSITSWAKPISYVAYISRVFICFCGLSKVFLPRLLYITVILIVWLWFLALVCEMLFTRLGKEFRLGFFSYTWCTLILLVLSKLFL